METSLNISSGNDIKMRKIFKFPVNNPLQHMKRMSNYFIYYLYKVAQMFNLESKCSIQCSWMFLVYKTVAHDFTSSNVIELSRGEKIEQVFVNTI